VIKISEGLIHDSNMPSKNLVATRDAYELQAEVQATTAPQQQTIVPRYLAVGNRCLWHEASAKRNRLKALMRENGRTTEAG
jgi:hypothetical protein